eukprot:GHVT01100815.1.p1 GENE.GHVT01100815.1~~GHVT01100815.1.p1  ORF type:complete len:283 (-),score=19.27 GHVT01100815.1:291-1139(-)
MLIPVLYQCLCSRQLAGRQCWIGRLGLTGNLSALALASDISVYNRRRLLSSYRIQNLCTSYTRASRQSFPMCVSSSGSSFATRSSFSRVFLFPSAKQYVEEAIVSATAVPGISLKPSFARSRVFASTTGAQPDMLRGVRWNSHQSGHNEEWRKEEAGKSVSGKETSDSTFASTQHDKRLNVAEQSFSSLKLTPNERHEVMESLTREDVENFPRFQRPFADHLWVECKAGHGGKPLPKKVRSRNFKGPGYGGHGGDVVLKASHHYNDFLHIQDKVGEIETPMN